MSINIPNQEIIRYLINTYFQAEGNPEENEFISPHWEYLSKFLKVQVDDQGNIVDLSGFGQKKHSNLIHRCMDNIWLLSHLVRLSNRKSIIDLRSKAVQVCKAMNLDVTYNVMVQIYVLEILIRYLSSEFTQHRMNVLMIGDGHGVLSGLFKSIFPNSTVILIDIGKTLLCCKDSTLPRQN